LFKYYSRVNCEYECALNQAAEICQCIPWNIPRLESDGIPFCNKFGNTCTQKVVQNQSIYKDCECPNDCEDVSFQILENSMDGFPDLCSSNSVVKAFANLNVENFKPR